VNSLQITIHGHLNPGPGRNIGISAESIHIAAVASPKAESHCREHASDMHCFIHFQTTSVQSPLYHPSKPPIPVMSTLSWHLKFSMCWQLRRFVLRHMVHTHFVQNFLLSTYRDI
jgi:hypothetical protein